jgi:hypothetical protein
MTSETKKFIELSDIVGLRLQCHACKCSLLLDIEREDGLVNSLMAASNATTHKVSHLRGNMGADAGARRGVGFAREGFPSQNALPEAAREQIGIRYRS